MKVSRALNLAGIALDQLVEAIRAGDVKTRDRWGKQELIPPPRWRKPPKSLEDLDQTVDVDRESFIETFPDAAKAPVNHGNAGRKSSGRSQGPAIIQTFQRMVEEGGVSLDGGSCTEAARKVHVEFPEYKEKYIAELIAPMYRQLKGKTTKP